MQFFGLLAQFENPEELLQAAKLVREMGYREIEAYTPFPVEGLPEALAKRRDPRIAKVALIGGILGGCLGFFMQAYTHMIGYPRIAAGRPPLSWPSFIPITFELMILGAALSAIFGMLAFNKLSLHYHPVFNAGGFRQHAAVDGFFLCVKAKDPRFDALKTHAELARLSPGWIWKVTF